MDRGGTVVEIPTTSGYVYIAVLLGGISILLVVETVYAGSADIKTAETASVRIAIPIVHAGVSGIFVLAASGLKLCC